MVRKMMFFHFKLWIVVTTLLIACNQQNQSTVISPKYPSWISKHEYLTIVGEWNKSKRRLNFHGIKQRAYHKKHFRNIVKEKLLEKNVNIENGSLFNSSMVELLEILNRNKISLTNENKEKRWSLMDFAIAACNPFAIDFLLEKGVDMATNSHPSSIDIYLGKYNSCTGKMPRELLIKYIIIKGLDVHGDKAATPIRFIPYTESAGLLKFFIKAGADLKLFANVKTNMFIDYSLLHGAANNSDPEMISVVYAHSNVDINYKNHLGETPVHIAAARGNVETAKKIVYLGANIYEKNDVGETVMDFIQQRINEIEFDSPFIEDLEELEKLIEMRLFFHTES